MTGFKCYLVEPGGGCGRVTMVQDVEVAAPAALRMRGREMFERMPSRGGGPAPDSGSSAALTPWTGESARGRGGQPDGPPPDPQKVAHTQVLRLVLWEGALYCIVTKRSRSQTLQTLQLRTPFRCVPQPGCS